MFWSDAFAIGGLRGIIPFYRSPSNTSDSSHSQDVPCPPHAAELSSAISQGMYTSSYGRFRPNNADCHSCRWCYRGGWHQSYPALILQAFYAWQKPMLMHEHVGSPYHTFVHCKGSAPAAPRRAGTSISVSLSGLPLSRPVPIVGLVGHYPTNNLIGRHPILRREFQIQSIPDSVPYQDLPTVSRGYSRPKGRLVTCY